MNTDEARKHFEAEARRLRGSAVRNLHEHRDEITKLIDKLTEPGIGYVQPGVAGTFTRSDYLERAHGDLARLWVSLEAIEVIDNVYDA